MGYFTSRLCYGRQPNSRSGKSTTEMQVALKYFANKRQCLVASIIDALRKREESILYHMLGSLWYGGKPIRMFLVETG
jgi:hypothetical protein